MFFSVQTINLGFLEAILSILKTFCGKKKAPAEIYHV